MLNADTRRWTPDPEINELLTSLFSQIRQVLGDHLVGLYLYGSLVAGDFDAEVSDIDLLAVTTDDISEKEFYRLHAMHDDFAAQHPSWDDRIEVAYLSVAGLRTFRTQNSSIAVISPGEPFHIKEAGADWLVNWWVVRERGVTLYGPPAWEVIDPIATDEFLQTVQDHALLWPLWVHDMREPKAQAYAVLTMCRALYALEFGDQPSKQRAAHWVQSRWPQWAALIQQALAWRVARSEDLPDGESVFPETERFVTFAANVIAERSENHE